MKGKIFIALITALSTCIFVSTAFGYTAEEDGKDKGLLVFQKEIRGKIIIFGSDDRFVAEIVKTEGRTFELALKEGEYRIVNKQEDGTAETSIILRMNETLELYGEDFESEESLPEDREDQPEPEKDTFLGRNATTRLFVEVGSKHTQICEENGVLLGGRMGITLNSVLTFGLAGYARVFLGHGAFDFDFDFEQGRPAYGGFFAAANFFPKEKIGFRVSLLAGAGNSWRSNFTILEPGVDLTLNLSQITSIRLGISMPITDEKMNDLSSPIFNFAFYFGR